MAATTATSQSQSSVIVEGTLSAAGCLGCILCDRIGIMVGGYMRCLGSITHLRARFGHGYQLELKLRDPSAEAVADLLSQGIDFPHRVTAADLPHLCAVLGDAGRAATVNADDEAGFGLWQSLDANGACTPDFFASWYVLQDYRAAMLAYVAAAFPGSSLVEQHEQNFRFSIPQVGRTLSSIFAKIEDARTGDSDEGSIAQRVEIEEYAVSQTTLEQVFNKFAAQQEEETGPIRGMQHATDPS